MGRGVQRTDLSSLGSMKNFESRYRLCKAAEVKVNCRPGRLPQSGTGVAMTGGGQTGVGGVVHVQTNNDQSTALLPSSLCMRTVGAVKLAFLGKQVQSV